jgi:hypothetical protein
MILYDRSKLDRLKYKFEGCESIDRNYSQAYQDMFVLTMLNGKKEGTYLEIGAMDAVFINNTFLLESKFNWRGLSVDIDPASKSTFESNGRKNSFILGDALGVDYDKFFQENNFGTQIDFLQVDIEPQAQTLECLKKLPFDKYRFSVIAFETDFYDKTVDPEESLRNREESRSFLQSLGYELIVGNIANVGPLGKDDLSPFEDWYVDPTVVSPELINLFKTTTEFNKSGEDFICNEI